MAPGKVEDAVQTNEPPSTSLQSATAPDEADLSRPGPSSGILEQSTTDTHWMPETGT